MRLRLLCLIVHEPVCTIRNSPAAAAMIAVLVQRMFVLSGRPVRAANVQEVTTNDYFLNSANNVSFFFEEDSFRSDGSLVQDKALSVNKCGHALHDLDPVFRMFSRSERMAAIYKSLGFQRPTPVQSMYIFKQPKIGGPVVAHQDRCARARCHGSR